MDMLKDLGYLKNAYGNMVHYGEYSCPSCNKPWKVSITRVLYKQVTQCKSCGMKKHGKTTHPLYKTWSGMIDRCYNKKAKAYKTYGAIGVTVCNEWKNDPSNFILWAEKNSWKKGLHLDKDILCKKFKISPQVYSPATCKFIKPSTNSQNTKQLIKSNTSGYRGVSRVGKMWEARVMLERVIHIIGYFNTAINAAKAYDFYVINNAKAEHIINGVLSEGEIVDLSKTPKSNNTSGFTGVYYNKRTHRYKAKISTKTGVITIGSAFKTAKEADQARSKYIMNLKEK